MLGRDLTVADGAKAGGWIEPGLGGAFGSVSQQVPSNFKAYARLFHRVTDKDGSYVTWTEVARRLGRVAHNEMQWHQIVGSSDALSFAGSDWLNTNPRKKKMQAEELDHLCHVLSEHAFEAENCFFGLCLIKNHWILELLSSEEKRLPRLNLPMDREHVVLQGPLSEINQIGSVNRSDVTWSFPAGQTEDASPSHPKSDSMHPAWYSAPNLIWPSDGSWLVVSEVDFDSTLIGGSRALIDALVMYPELEVYEVEPRTSLAAHADRINRVSEEGPER